MSYREERDPVRSFRLGARVHISSDTVASIHGRVTARIGPKVIVYDEEWKEYILDYKSDRLWHCHCKEKR